MQSDAPNSQFRSTQPRLQGLTPEYLARLRDLLARACGIYMDTPRQRVLESALARRLALTNDDLAGYERRLSAPEGRTELRRLAELVLNHETIFFRNKPHMRALREVLLPELARRKSPGAPIRLWSAGCSTGEEPYSLAITALETFGSIGGPLIDVWATDLSEVALAHARAGYYQGRSIGNVAPDVLARHFTRTGAGYTVGERVRKLVRFETINLLEPFPPAAQGVDIIFCQNVLIYFQLETCRAILERFYACLPEGGLLFLGFSETLWNVFDGFHAREVSGAYVYYKGTHHTAPAQTPQRATASAPRTTLRRSTGEQTAAPPVTISPKLALESVLQQTITTQVTNDQDLLQQARALLDQQQADQALDMLCRITPRAANAPQALTLMASIHADRGDLELAIAEARRAIELDALCEEAYVLLGVLHGRQGQWQEAVRYFERARYLSPSAPLVSFRLAEAHQQLGHTDLAAREYRATLRKLEAHPPDILLDGVAVDWLKETCRRQLEQLLR